MEVWDGFECEKFVFDGRNAIAVFPKNVCCMLIDAPVLNFCDYPGRLPADRCGGVWENK